MESRIVPIPATFKSIVEFKHLCKTDPTIPALYYDFTTEELTPLAKLFAASTDLEDWLWLARYNAAFISSGVSTSGLSPLADSVLYVMANQLKDGKVDDVTRIKALFSSARPFISLAAICPTFTDAIMVEFFDLLTYRQELFSFFAEPEIFDEFVHAFLQRSDINRGELNRFCVMILGVHWHLPYLYEHSNYFANLDKKFIEFVLERFKGNLSIASMLETGDNAYVLENFSHVIRIPGQLSSSERLLPFASHRNALLTPPSGAPIAEREKLEPIEAPAAGL